MQFLHLFSFVVVASYAAALPQPAGLSEKYSNNVDTTLASGLEARSYQPELNSYKELATSTLLKRRGDSLELPGNNSEGSVGDNSEESTGDNLKDRLETILKERQKTIVKDRLETILKDRLETIVKERQKTIVKERQKTILKDRLETILKERQKTIVKERQKTILKDPTHPLHPHRPVKLLQSISKSGRQATEFLKEWVEDIGKGLVDIIKLGLGDEEYSKVESLLDDASEKVVADASDNVQQMTAALLNIEKKVGSAKQEVDAVQAAFERVLEAYKLYIGTLESQLIRFKEGEHIQSHLSAGVECLVEFSENQKGLYYTIIDGLFGRVFASYKLYIETLQSQVTRFEAGEPIRDDVFTTMDSLAGFSEKKEALYYTVGDGLGDAPSE
ncbi:hypothetical protein BASA62_001521 [Batrachochytrium salamandrivorans]|nr:hypothetical protein BASA62_001521 [Batrachochytrium salamandrivorans]